MKQSVLLLTIVLLFGFTTKYDPLTQKERDFAAKFLTESQQRLFSAVHGLSEAQLKFKPAADVWSIEDCVKHVAMSESGLWQMVDGVLKNSVNAGKRVNIKATDEQLIQGVEDRSQKAKTYEALDPANTPYKSLDEALNAFKESRSKLVSFVTSTNDDLRNRVAELPMGSYDAYQLILLISAHSNRHTKQIEEVKASTGYPAE